MAAEKEEIIIDLKINKGDTEKNIDEATKSIGKLTDAIKETTDANKELEKQGKKNSDEYVQNSKQIEINKEALSKANATRKELIKTLSIEDHSLEAVRKSTSDLIKEQQKLNLSTEEGRKRLQAINKEIDKNNKFIKENTSLMQQQKQNIGNYASALDGLIPGLSSATSAIESVSAGGSKLVPVLGAVSTALTALVGLYVSSAAGARDLESAQTQLGTSFNTLGNNLAKLVGADGKGGGLLAGLAYYFNTRIFGAVAGASGLIAAQAVQALHEIELLEIDAKRVAKNALDEAEKLRQIRDNTDKTNKERLEAASKVQGFVDVRELAQLNVQKQKLEQLRMLLKLNEGDLELQKQIKEVEFEISDIREDSQGQRTEALNGILSLQREIAAQAEIDRINAIVTDEEEIKRVSVRREMLIAEIELRSSLADQQININKRMNDVKVAQDKKALEEKKKNEDAAYAERLAKDEEDKANRLATLNQFVNDSAAVYGRQSLIFKAAAVAQTTIETYKGAQAAFSSLAGIPIVGPALGAIAAATAIAAGLIRVRQIVSVKEKYAQGGQANRMSNGVRYGTVGGLPHSSGGTKYYGEDGHTVELEKGEGWYVAKVSAHQKFLSGMSGLNQSEGGKSWNVSRPPVRQSYALGGQVTANNAQSGIDYNRLAEAVSQQKIYTAITDINDGQSRYARIQEDSTF